MTQAQKQKQALAQVGLQLYTLRDQTRNDFLGTIRKVAEIGYQAVEFAGYFNVPARELRRTLDECGLSAPSSHVGLDFTDIGSMKSALAAQIEYAQELGLDYIITPWSPVPELPSMEDVNRIAQFLYQAGEQVTAAGLKYGYHNHAFEFKQVDGKAIIDHLLERIPAELMTVQFDLGWVHMGGSKPADYVRKYAGRVPLVHMKDFGENGMKDTEVGQGVVDFKSVFDIAQQAGIRYYIVEQEDFKSSSLESAQQSLQYFKQLGLA